MAQMSTDMEQLRKENEDLKGEVVALQLQAQYIEEGFQQLLKDERSKAQHQLQSMRKEVESSSTTQALRKELESTTQALRDLENIAQTLRKDVAAATARCKELEEENQKLIKMRDSFKKSLEAVDGRNKELETFSNRQQTKYTQMERTKQQLEVENQQLKEQLQVHRFWKVPREDISLNMLKVLGTGSWGVVVEGTFRGQKVAVKSMHDAIQIPQFIDVFHKEIDIMAQIRHPNLVLFIAAAIDTENAPLIVTELLDMSLRKAYMKNLLQDSNKLSIFRDVASALNYLHLHQGGEIIHRDVSSANVLLEAKPNNQWKAKLSDLGSAKLAIEAKTMGPGTPVYTAPEILKEGKKQTAKVDVYSFGVLLCEVILGRFPEEGKLPTMIEAVRGRCAALHGLITSCTQRKPKHRPAMSTLLDKLDKLCETEMNPHQVTL